MTTVSEFHQKAMDLADEAFRLLRRGEETNAQILFLEALCLETEAASLLPPSEESEPSRSILYRSAASLAFDAGDYETAERLVVQGLTGFPPREIKGELKELYDKIVSRHPLKSQGMEALISQDAVNRGQREINYLITEADTKIVEALKALSEVIRKLLSVSESKTIDFSQIEAAITAAHETIEKLEGIAPPESESSRSLEL